MAIDNAEREARLAALQARMAEHSLSGHWEKRKAMAELVPWVWPWESIYGCLYEAGEVMGIGGAEEANNRRTVQLVNPGLADVKATSRTLQMSIQLVNGGEIAASHRHSIAALRFVIESTGTYTTVEGEQMMMAPGDLVLTPNWQWHDHANYTDGPAIWIDVLDLHLVRGLGAAFQEPFPEGAAQPIAKGDGYSRRLLSAVRPPDQIGSPEFAAFNYKWTDTLAALEEREDVGDVDPYDGVLLRYANPLTGGPTMPTIDCHVQLIPPGAKLVPHRHTGTTIYHVVRGQGTSVVGKTRADGETLVWGTRDCFFVPSWSWHEHWNESSEAAILFSVTDRPVLERIGLFREDAG